MRILVSACLIDQPVRYDGRARTYTHPLLARWQREGRLLPVCPELAGGLKVPRPAAEIRAGDGHDVLQGRARVINCWGQDQSQAFIQGAHSVLEQARAGGARIAILTDKSPSCGSQRIYDGSFTGTQIPGIGVTTALLEAHGIAVFGPQQLEEAAALLQRLEQSSTKNQSSPSREGEA